MRERLFKPKPEVMQDGEGHADTGVWATQRGLGNQKLARRKKQIRRLTGWSRGASLRRSRKCLLT